MSQSLISQSAPTSVVVLGAGYAGLLFTARLARKMARENVAITLVNDADTFTERLRLHQFAANQSIPWRSIPDVLRGTGVRFVRAEVSAIHPERHEVMLRQRQEGEQDTPRELQPLHYDYLVYALGSLTERWSVPGVDAYAYTLAPRGPLSAAALRDILPSVNARGGQVVVCGAGATGIETAAELAQSYPHLHVRLVTQGGFGEFTGSAVAGQGVAAYMRRSLERLGVAISEHVTITAVQNDRVRTDQGQDIPCDLCVWAGGFAVPTVAREAGLHVNERGQIVVDPFLRSLSDPTIYAIGDAASPAGDPGNPVRMSAITASILGAHGADSLSATLRGRPAKPLSFAYPGQGIALGRHDAIGFNCYPDDHPHRPYFTGWLGYRLREWFVDLLANAPRRERHAVGSYFWFGKGRYAREQRRRKMAVQPARPQLRQA